MRGEHGRQSTKHRHKAQGRLGTQEASWPSSDLASPGQRQSRTLRESCPGHSKKVPYKDSEEGPHDCMYEHNRKCPQSIMAMRLDREENNDRCHPMSLLRTGPELWDRLPVAVGCVWFRLSSSMEIPQAQGRRGPGRLKP